VVRELRRGLEGRKPRSEKDLVRVCTADSGDCALVAQEGMELPTLARQDLGGRGGIELKSVGTEVPEVLVELLRADEPDTGPLLLPSLGEDELAAVRESQAEHRRLRRLATRRDVAEPSRAHQMNAEHEIDALDREEEVLAAPARALEASAVELGERRRERLQRRDVGRPCLLDRRPGHEGGGLADPRPHLR